MPQIGAARSQRHDGHDFRRCGDHKAGLAIGAFALRAHAHRNVAQRAIIHVHRARPGNLRGIEIQRVAEKQMRIDHRRQQIMRGSDGVKVAMKMQIDLLAWFHLRQAAARRSALHPEHRPQRRLTRSQNRFAADPLEPLRQADRHHGLSLA